MEPKYYNSETIAFIKGHLKDDPFSLSLNAKKFGAIPIEFAIDQIHARQKAMDKLPGWYHNFDLVFPPSISVEQSSSEKTAAYKASLFSGEKFVDLTGGMGVDCTFFSKKFRDVYYVEKSKELVEVAEHNFGVLGLSNVQTIHSQAEEFLATTNEQFDLIYLDPGRRPNKGKKTFLLQDSEPNVLDLMDVLFEHTNNLLLKLSPLLDIKYAIDSLKYVDKVWVVAVNNECKELLVLLNKQRRRTEIEAIDIAKEGNGFVFNYTDESNTRITESEPLKYLYEPNAAILKAGAFKTIAQRFGINKLHPHTHLYTSNFLVDDFPGRKFMIKAIISPSKKVIGKLILEKKANIAVRNFPMKPEALKKKWGITDGGSQYLFAVTTVNQKKLVLVCEKI